MTWFCLDDCILMMHMVDVTSLTEPAYALLAFGSFIYDLLVPSPKLVTVVEAFVVGVVN